MNFIKKKVKKKKVKKLKIILKIVIVLRIVVSVALERKMGYIEGVEVKRIGDKIEEKRKG